MRFNFLACRTTTVETDQPELMFILLPWSPDVVKMAAEYDMKRLICELER